MDLESVRDLIIPLVAIIAIPTVFCVFFYLRYRTRKDLQATLRAAIEQGQELTPEVLEQLGGPPVSGERDLRRGVITIAAGIALVVFSFLHTGVSDDDVPF